MSSLDFPLGGTVCTGSGPSIFEVVFGKPPRTDREMGKALAELRSARQLHTLHTKVLRDFPSDAGRRNRRAIERQIASEAVAKIRVGRMGEGRAA